MGGRGVLDREREWETDDSCSDGRAGEGQGQGQRKGMEGGGRGRRTAGVMGGQPGGEGRGAWGQGTGDGYSIGWSESRRVGHRDVRQGWGTLFTIVYLCVFVRLNIHILDVIFIYSVQSMLSLEQ